ncbi:MAG: DUF1491 family protein [Deltaproteobacteria bacterium]
MTPRLTADIWVSAYLNRLRLQNIPAYVMQKGDVTAGTVMVKVATLNGQAQVWERSFDLMSGERRWIVVTEGDERSVDDAVNRQKSRDPDLWVIEVEDARGRSLLDEPGLSD